MNIYHQLVALNFSSYCPPVIIFCNVFAFQKKVADKKKAAAYMREYRLKQKLERSSQRQNKCGQTTPNATSTPLAGPSESEQRVSSQETMQRISTPPRRQRMRQHCYNIASKVRSSSMIACLYVFLEFPLLYIAWLRSSFFNYQTPFLLSKQVKRSLKMTFNDNEVAAITCNLVLRKTPEKRKKNFEHLLGNATNTLFFIIL